MEIRQDFPEGLPPPGDLQPDEPGVDGVSATPDSPVETEFDRTAQQLHELTDSEPATVVSENAADLPEPAPDRKTNALKALLATNLGVFALASTLLLARGGNYKVVRQALQEQGKLNAKEPLPPEQKKLRRRKRRKK